MRIIGLTGGIATGKSTVANVVVQDGYPLVDCDKVARDVVRKGRWGHRRVVAIFGEDVLLPNGELDRPALGNIVFNNPELRKKLNKATHWPVFVELGKQVLINWLLCKPTLVIDMPLLFETGFQHKCSFTILVTCGKETQLQRLMQRDSSTEQQALSRIKSQMPQDKKIELADEVIDNNGSKEETIAQTKEVLRRRARPGILHLLVLNPIGLLICAGSAFMLSKSVLS